MRFVHYRFKTKVGRSKRAKGELIKKRWTRFPYENKPNFVFTLQLVKDFHRQFFHCGNYDCPCLITVLTVLHLRVPWHILLLFVHCRRRPTHDWSCLTQPVGGRCLFSLSSPILTVCMFFSLSMTMYRSLLNLCSQGVKEVVLYISFTVEPTQNKNKREKGLDKKR